MRKDDINLTEAYLKIYQKQTEVLEEGIFDRAKAQASGIVKGVAPMKRLGSLAAKGLGKLAGTLSPEAGTALQKTGERMGKEASNSGLTAKVKSIMQSHSGSIMKISNEIINDLNKLQLNPENMTPEQFGEQMKAQLETMLNAQLPQAAAQDTSTQDTSTEEPSETQETSGETTTPAPTTSPAPTPFSNKPASKKTKNIPIVSSVKARPTAAKKPALAKKPAPAKKPVKARTR
jgi:hypothetical protein